MIVRFYKILKRLSYFDFDAYAEHVEAVGRDAVEITNGFNAKLIDLANDARVIVDRSEILVGGQREVRENQLAIKHAIALLSEKIQRPKPAITIH